MRTCSSSNQQLLAIRHCPCAPNGWKTTHATRATEGHECVLTHGAQPYPCRSRDVAHRPLSPPYSLTHPYGDPTKAQITLMHIGTWTHVRSQQQSCQQAAAPHRRQVQRRAARAAHADPVPAVRQVARCKAGVVRYKRAHSVRATGPHLPQRRGTDCTTSVQAKARAREPLVAPQHG